MPLAGASPSRMCIYVRTCACRARGRASPLSIPPPPPSRHHLRGAPPSPLGQPPPVRTGGIQPAYNMHVVVQCAHVCTRADWRYTTRMPLPPRVGPPNPHAPQTRTPLIPARTVRVKVRVRVRDRVRVKVRVIPSSRPGRLRRLCPACRPRRAQPAHHPALRLLWATGRAKRAD